jgi:acetylornithine aminotransferase
VPDEGYLTALRRICDEQGWLLIFDEIQSGLCRSGRWYAHQFEPIRADVLTTAKALANGFPIGACTARDKAAELMTPGRHGSTFGGNPLACRTACAVLDIMKDQDLASRSNRLGQEIRSALRDRIGEHPAVVDIRGKGLMMGIELDRDATQLSEQALNKGLLINITHNKVIRLLPPLIIDREQAEEIADTVSGLVESL